jgi:hypothetical protein
MTCLELPVVLWVAIIQGQLEIMQHCMHTHELDYHAASALSLLVCSISICIFCFIMSAFLSSYSKPSPDPYGLGQLGPFRTISH